MRRRKLYRTKPNYRARKKQGPGGSVAKYAIAAFLSFCIVYGISHKSGIAVFHDPGVEAATPPPKIPPPDPLAGPVSKNVIRQILAGTDIINPTRNAFDVNVKGRKIRIVTSIDTPLQNHLLENLETTYAKHIGIVAMDPYTGRILAMASHDKPGSGKNACASANFPAASIFKIVTAAAVIEKCGIGRNSTLAYSGGKYTLYKGQLKKRSGRGTRRISFEDSFAQSVNPVFGKMGMHLLGGQQLSEYAESFGFNREIDFETDLPPSTFHVSDTPYQWAEIASGFNRDTTLSPIHGAMMVSAVLNNGRMAEPGLVDRIIDENGNVIYEAKTAILNNAMTPEASATIRRMMKTAVRSGTCRKTFKGYGKDYVFSKLDIGGKTGSINDDGNHDIRYDWFVGFAEEKNGLGKIAVSVVVAHDKYIGKRSGSYAKMAMRRYFSGNFEDGG